jgi:hypothetical protein
VAALQPEASVAAMRARVVADPEGVADSDVPAGIVGAACRRRGGSHAGDRQQQEEEGEWRHSCVGVFGHVAVDRGGTSQFNLTKPVYIGLDHGQMRCIFRE